MRLPRLISLLCMLSFAGLLWPPAPGMVSAQSGGLPAEHWQYTVPDGWYGDATTQRVRLFNDPAALEMSEVQPGIFGVTIVAAIPGTYRNLRRTDADVLEQLRDQIATGLSARSAYSELDNQQTLTIGEITVFTGTSRIESQELLIGTYWLAPETFGIVMAIAYPGEMETFMPELRNFIATTRYAPYAGNRYFSNDETLNIRYNRAWDIQDGPHRALFMQGAFSIEVIGIRQFGAGSGQAIALLRERFPGAELSDPETLQHDGRTLLHYTFTDGAASGGLYFISGDTVPLALIYAAPQGDAYQIAYSAYNMATTLVYTPAESGN